MDILRFDNWRALGLACAMALLTACQSLGDGDRTLTPPSISLSNLQVRDVGIFEQRYGLTLRVQNPNPAPLPISGLSYRVTLNDTDFGHGVARKEVTVPPYGEALVDVDLVSSAWQLVQRVREWSTGNIPSLKIAITGDVSVANRSLQLPFTYHGQIGGRTSATTSR
jgi:LEA14-like dessication related protein